MATQPRTFLSQVRRRTAEARSIAQLLQTDAMANSGRWFTRERAWINEQHIRLCRIPAPTFFESERAEWLRTRFEELGWEASFDRAGNVVAHYGNHEPAAERFVLSAHLDTVLAPRRLEDIYYGPDGRLHGPGVSDNGSGLVTLLAVARFFHEHADLHSLAASLLLVASIGEEGEGNLSGMRFLCRQFATVPAVDTFLVLDGPSLDHVTTQALASQRFEVSFHGPGGHSWNDHGAPNAVHALSETIASFGRAAEEFSASAVGRRISYNFGIFEGGNSINSIPSVARAKLDLRSEDGQLLEALAGQLTGCVERALERENRAGRNPRLTAKIRELGCRPGGRLPADSELLETVHAVNKALGLRARLDCASTDANIPLSMGLAAISIGVGGSGGGAHTADEWYSPEGRELGLRRLVLLLLALAGRTRSDVETLETSAE